MVKCAADVEFELIYDVVVGLEVTGHSRCIELVQKLVSIGDIGSVMLVVVEVKLVRAHDWF